MLEPWASGCVGLDAGYAACYTHLLWASVSWQVSADTQLRVSHALNELIHSKSLLPINKWSCHLSHNSAPWKKRLFYLINKQYILVSLITYLFTCVVRKNWWDPLKLKLPGPYLRISWDVQEVKSRTPALCEALTNVSLPRLRAWKRGPLCDWHRNRSVSTACSPSRWR